MAEFQEVARHWKRMCKQFRKPNTCHGCPIAEHQKMFEACSDGDVDTVAMESLVMAWAAENPEPVYPTFGEWLEKQGIVKLVNSDRYEEDERKVYILLESVENQIPADIAEKLGIEPKEE